MKRAIVISMACCLAISGCATTSVHERSKCESNSIAVGTKYFEGSSEKCEHDSRSDATAPSDGADTFLGLAGLAAVMVVICSFGSCTGR